MEHSSKTQKQLTKIGNLLGQLAGGKALPSALRPIELRSKELQKKTFKKDLEKMSKSLSQLRTQGDRNRDRADNLRLSGGAGTNGKSIVSAPAAIGLQSKQTLRHTPMVVTGSCYIGTFSRLISNNTAMSSANDNGASTNRFSVDPAAAGVVATDYRLFPGTLRNMASCFTKYRFRKFLLTYIPLVPTSTPGNIVVASNPEVAVYSQTANNPSELVSFENNVQFPVWSTASLDCLASGGLSREWCWFDPEAGVVNESNERQESPGSIWVGIYGGPDSTAYGTFRLDFEIQYEGLANSAIFNSVQAPSTAPSAQGEHVLPEPQPQLPPDDETWVHPNLHQEECRIPSSASTPNPVGHVTQVIAPGNLRYIPRI